MSVLQEDEVLVMTRKKSKDAVKIHAILWVMVVLFAVASLIEESALLFLCRGVPCVVSSVVYAFFTRGRAVIVSEYGIESVSFFSVHRIIPWECVVSYSEKIKRGEYYIDMRRSRVLDDDDSGWVEDSFRLKLTLSEGRPLYVSNDFTEYKRFKKLLKEKEIPRASKTPKPLTAPSKNDAVQEFKAQVQGMVARYADRLAQQGVEIRISKRYFKVPVREWLSGHGLLEEIDRAKAHKREKERGYHYQKNTYHCLLLTLAPINGSVRKDRCKDYGFILRKKERAFIGDVPVETIADGEKLLAKIEKRVQKICRQAEKRTPQKVCGDTLWDALRYVCSAKYVYKDPILGRDRLWFELGLALGIAVLILAVAICGEIVWN